MILEKKLREEKIGKKILLAEDDKPLARAMELKLNNAILDEGGFRVTVVNDGEAALEKVKEESFDLILLDIIMPKMSGFEVLEELKKQGNQTPVIITSNLSQEEDMKRAKELGAIDYLVKSNIEINKIVAHIQKILENK